ncbi:MAG: zinc-binding dehydrogenase [Pseudomonadota bacterium]
MTDIPATMRRMMSEATSGGTLELRLEEVATPTPKPGELLVRVEATPINPSDLGLFIGMADYANGTVGGTAELPTLSMPVPDYARGMYAPRLDNPQTVGNEGAGVVVAAGSPDHEGMIGRAVAFATGDLYSDYCVVPVPAAIPLPDGVTPRDGASSFVNPMTALSMTEVMRREGHKALVHTAAASNLGQMLNKICIADGIPLVNVVRKAEQAEILKGIGADYVVNSSDADFFPQLVAAIDATGATLGFDAVGGGALAGTIITAMEAGLVKKMGEFSRYGSPTWKQVYVYGRLDLSPTTVPPSVGMAWGVGGFLLPNFLATISQEDRMKMGGRVIAELKTTFASHYTDEISLTDVLKPEMIAKYDAKATGTKFLVNPTL